MAKTQTTEANAAAFTKAQLVASQRYVHRRDLIGALLEDGKTYTLNEVDDPATSVGRSTKIYNNCVLDGDVLLSMFNAEGDFVEQTLEGYCDSFTRPEKHTNPSYM